MDQAVTDHFDFEHQDKIQASLSMFHLPNQADANFETS